MIEFKKVGDFMLVEFKKPDPRAGLRAELDTLRAKQLIKLGAAVEVKPDYQKNSSDSEKVSSPDEKETTSGKNKAKKS